MPTYAPSSVTVSLLQLPLLSSSSSLAEAQVLSLSAALEVVSVSWLSAADSRVVLPGSLSSRPAE